ncbi:hypothetical protein PN36_32545 [Candidatus Thiomargarita nelsonii]|uniref:Uncharacterized protein n=1 Tax=Candidatus Thiomargarita nelsonii TaxID=1003181 RepID=A0A4E0QRE7_9GAMM|nr:hypothetical protein PN36_32545 [Candidatus Thiomargarita nelsonii]
MKKVMQQRLEELVKAQMIDKAWDYRYSAYAHLFGKYHIVNVDNLITLIGDWKVYLLETHKYDSI